MRKLSEKNDGQRGRVQSSVRGVSRREVCTLHKWSKADVVASEDRRASGTRTDGAREQVGRKVSRGWRCQDRASAGHQDRGRAEGERGKAGGGAAVAARTCASARRRADRIVPRKRPPHVVSGRSATVASVFSARLSPELCPAVWVASSSSILQASNWSAFDRSSVHCTATQLQTFALGFALRQFFSLRVRLDHLRALESCNSSTSGWNLDTHVVQASFGGKGGFFIFTFYWMF